MYFDLEHQVVTNFSRVDFLSIRRGDSHRTRRRWTSIGNRAGCRQHLNIEANRDVLFSGLVDTLDVVGLSLICHQLGMLLNDEHKAGNAIDVVQTAFAKLHLERLCACRSVSRQIQYASALFFLAVTFHVQYTVEASVLQFQLDLNTVSKTLHVHGGSREVSTVGLRSTFIFSITQIAGNADTNASMLGGVAQGVDATHLLKACVLADAVVAPIRIGTVRVEDALGLFALDALAKSC